MSKAFTKESDELEDDECESPRYLATHVNLTLARRERARPSGLGNSCCVNRRIGDLSFGTVLEKLLKY
jgi:hypothetical protein